jgi:hypothetical protein
MATHLSQQQQQTQRGHAWPSMMGQCVMGVKCNEVWDWQAEVSQLCRCRRVSGLSHTHRRMWMVWPHIFIHRHPFISLTLPSYAETREGVCMRHPCADVWCGCAHKEREKRRRQLDRPRPLVHENRRGLDDKRDLNPLFDVNAYGKHRRTSIKSGRRGCSWGQVGQQHRHRVEMRCVQMGVRRIVRVRLLRSEKMRREGEVAADEFQVRRMGRMGVL